MPGYGFSGMDKGYDAESVIANHRAVKLGTTPEGCTAITGNTDRAIGVSIFHVTSDEMLRGKGATIREEGIVEWEVGSGGVTRGDAATIDAEGRVVTAATGNLVYGYVRQTGVAGDIVAVTVDFTVVQVSP